MDNKKKDEDQVTIERVLAGDVKAFEVLVNKYQKKIYFLALRMTKNHDVADELAQESFVRAYMSLSGFQTGRSFYTWLYRIAVNQVLNYLKHKSFTVSLDSPSGRTYLESIPHSPDQLSRLVNQEQMEVFQAALDKLPSPQKTIFLLKTYEEFSYEEISKIVGCSVGTVMSRLFRARAKLRNALKQTDKRKNGKLQK
ncbi:MAG: sigma-70 family RNA polymerase sigma factor [candidate division Zixibacteria bacterium]|nr:sigma-70 family RNA polymerase sigma factor [candidate division Zixibacteria bacterium]